MVDSPNNPNVTLDGGVLLIDLGNRSKKQIKRLRQGTGKPSMKSKGACRNCEPPETYRKRRSLWSSLCAKSKVACVCSNGQPPRSGAGSR